ncbi:insulinase family protein [Haloimpatiens sp. FM7330]|uniref:insulinase family protein n=1 Tax=Haloimpatiens sp. FM7330 TaxID=3298610 RepID=UPI00362B95D9
MNKKLRPLIVFTLATLITSQTVFAEGYTKPINTKTQITYSNEKNNSLGGFVLESKKWIKDLKCNVCIYKHKKSGAHLVFVQNNSEDKMFCVNFKTPAKNDKGSNHIIEHSVLCGSKKYPVKDPFIQMSKQSLNTFLNAMTAHDSTMYPVSSKNDKDFNNLMSVYLDAIFYPNMVKNKRIFEQEGWRYELNSPNGELKYNGIVYNEMKGNYSDPQWILNRAIAQSLFPDNSYKFESGGLPEAIPNLTYEEFVKTYNEYYTPSNSYFYLYGNLNIEKTLKFIGENYLNSFDKKKVDTSIKLQKPFTKRKTKVAEYSISEKTSTKNKTYLSLNYVVDKITNKDTVLNFSVLKDLLTGNSSAPLSKALRENGFGENVQISFDISYDQPIFSIIAKNVNESQKDKFEKVVNDTLQNIVKNGFDENFVNSVINIYELSKRSVKGNFPLMYNSMIMQSWLHGGDPTLYLNINSDICNIKNKIKDGTLQTLIQKYLINNTHSSLVILKPVPGLQKTKENNLKAKLAKYKASLSNQQINDIIKNTKDIRMWQQTPDSKKLTNTLPTLTRTDINKNAKKYTTIEKKENGVKVLYHPIFTNGIGHVSLYFDTSKVPQDKLGYMYLLSNVLSQVDTKNYTKAKLSQEILSNSGGITFAPNCYPKSKNNDVYYPKMMANITSLNSKLPKNFNLLEEIMYNSNLKDKTRLKQIIHTMKQTKENQLMSNGAGMAIQKLLSYTSKYGRYNNFVNENLYSFLCDLDKNFNTKSNEIVKNLEDVRNLIFNKQDLIVSYTGEEENYKYFAQSFDKFSNNLRNEKLPKYKYSFNNSKQNEGIIIPSKVQYVVKGGDLLKIGYIPNGKLLVLQNILQSGYLWNNIRVKGGAYGANVALSNSTLVFSSYRDPNLKETLNTFNKIPEYLKNFNADEKQMTNYVIGTIGKLDTSNNMLSSIMGPAADGLIADGLYLSGIKQSDLQKERNEILSTTVEDIRKFAPIIDAILKENHFCVVGNEKKINENKKDFMSITSLQNCRSSK